jgi:UDP-N-acetylmuramoylalanine--D-glutamate ligase
VYRFLRQHKITPLCILNDSALTVDVDLPVYTGEQIKTQLNQIDILVKSPGVSLYQPNIVAAQQAGVRVTSLVNLWFAAHPNAKTVCITASKGKSTTSSLLAFVLQQHGVHAVLGGNVGTALFDLPDNADVYVIELSSYQTADFTGQATVAAVLNLFPEHLDWHGDVARYYRDKLNLLSQAQTVVLNAADATLLAHTRQIHKKLYFNQAQGFHHDDQHLYLGAQKLLSLTELKLVGGHNLSNVCAALCLAQTMGYPPQALLTHVRAFCGLPHRLYDLGKRHHRYIDDSISTTPQSVVAALKAYPQQTITVLVGGYDRGLDWQVLADYLPHNPHVHAVITMPQNGDKIQRCLQKYAHAERRLWASNSLAEAVQLAQRITPQDGIILLSPGAPSYGLFDNFQQRGQAFLHHSGLK